MLMVLAAEGYGLYLAANQGPMYSGSIYGSSSCQDCYGDLYTSARTSSCSHARRNDTLCQLATGGGVLGNSSSGGGSLAKELRDEVALRGAVTGVCMLQNLLLGPLQLGAAAVANVTQQGQCASILSQAADVVKLSAARPGI
jgi:hypothetical protein